tara:strand:+ start:121 stop:387 length:267 start_codon:yes stop_codon:yes gene_type:complete
MVWEKITVSWVESGIWSFEAQAQKVWAVNAYDKEGNREALSEHHRKEWALDDAKIYAFDTSCGPERAGKIEVYTKANKLIKIIESSKK